MSPPPVLEIKEIFCYDNYGYRVQAGSDDMIKVIASDMDGTLLNSEHTIRSEPMISYRKYKGRESVL